MANSQHHPSRVPENFHYGDFTLSKILVSAFIFKNLYSPLICFGGIFKYFYYFQNLLLRIESQFLKRLGLLNIEWTQKITYIRQREPPDSWAWAGFSLCWLLICGLSRCGLRWPDIPGSSHLATRSRAPRSSINKAGSDLCSTWKRLGKPGTQSLG